MAYRKLLLGFSVLGAVLLALLAYRLFGPGKNSAGGAASHAAIARTTGKRSEKPVFTVYYPTHTPAGLSIDRNSIEYSKNSFSFDLQRDGKRRFFVSEQPVGDGFRLSKLKSKLISVTDFKASLGQGVIGGLDAGLITAVQTKDSTLILVNCTDTVCGTPSVQIVDGLKIVDDVSVL